MSKTVMGTVEVSSLTKRETFVSILIIGLLFFIFGFVSWVNAILIPYFKIACELTNFESYLVTFAFYISYLVFSIPSSYLLKRIGFKKGMMIGFLGNGRRCFYLYTCGAHKNLMRSSFWGYFQ
ncbi:MAG TPA: hypothetical protein VIJ75_14320 [Hanamia sp.]